MGEINAMQNIKNNEKSANIQAYLAEFLPFNFFLTIHWELNKFSHEEVKEHLDFILPSTIIGYVVYPLSDQSNDMASYISAMLSAE